MQIILLERVENLGKAGDIVRVRNGYGRNFLVPQKKALRATEQNKAYFEAKRAEIEKANEAKREAAEVEAKKIRDVFVVIVRQVGEDGRLFGSVNSRDIAAQLLAQGEEIDRRLIHLQQPIKALGVHPVKIALHPDVAVQIFVNVARNAEEAELAKQEFLNPTKKEEAAPAEASDASAGEAQAASEEAAPAKKAAKKKSSKKEAAEKEESAA